MNQLELGLNNPGRDRAIRAYELYHCGVRGPALAAAEGVSRERVRQLVSKGYFITKSQRLKTMSPGWWRDAPSWRSSFDYISYSGIAVSLRAYGLFTLLDLKLWLKAGRRLADIPGIGPTAERSIMDWIEESART